MENKRHGNKKKIIDALIDNQIYLQKITIE